MMKLIHTLTFLCSVSFAFSQVKFTFLDTASIAKSIKYEGHVINAVSFADKMGQHIIITTETGEMASKARADEDYRDAYLYAYHYLVENDSFIRTWRVTDFVKDCPVDLWAKFIKNSFAVTDLNKDEYAEVWMMYKTVCHGDVSPSDMKIIMYEKDKKYAMRGTNQVKITAKESIGGVYKMDESFEIASKEFQEYAKKLWEKNKVETWD